MASDFWPSLVGLAAIVAASVDRWRDRTAHQRVDDRRLRLELAASIAAWCVETRLAIGTAEWRSLSHRPRDLEAKLLMLDALQLKRALTDYDSTLTLDDAKHLAGVLIEIEEQRRRKEAALDSCEFEAAAACRAAEVAAVKLARPYLDRLAVALAAVESAIRT